MTPQLEATRIRERFERLLAAGVAIFSRHELDQVLQEVVDAAREVVGARYAALGVVGADRQSLVQFVTSGVDAETRTRIGDLPRGHGLLGHVIHEAKPIRTADLNRHPQRYGFPPHHPPMKSFLGVPVKSPGGVFGNLYLTEKIGAAEFDDEDEAIAVLLASQAAVAVENAGLLGQIRAMQRQRDLFFAMMNHELRNALTGVYGWAERLVRRKSPDTAEQAAREVYEAADHTIVLLNNFLDLMRLEQILLNLLSNAIRHSPEASGIELAVAEGSGQTVFSVIDHGPGVPVEQQERIFEPFERFEPHSGLGTGLGLPVSRRLAAALGGSLTVEETPSGGATFILKLPS